MSLTAASPSLADRLVTACFWRDLPSVKAAVADGASVNEKGTDGNGPLTWLPLTSAVTWQHDDIVAWLLSQGADPNGYGVMCDCASDSTAAILRLLIDAGGDVNQGGPGGPPLFYAIRDNKQEAVQVLLAEPSLDITATYLGKSPEQYARDTSSPALADMIAKEVSEPRICCLRPC